jgi:hypothetical protein
VGIIELADIFEMFFFNNCDELTIRGIIQLEIIGLVEEEVVIFKAKFNVV